MFSYGIERLKLLRTERYEQASPSLLDHPPLLFAFAVHANTDIPVVIVIFWFAKAATDNIQYSERVMRPNTEYDTVSIMPNISHVRARWSVYYCPR